MKIPELKQLINENNIKLGSNKNKPELIKILIDHKVLPPDYVDMPPKVKEVRATDSKHKSPRTQPCSVEVKDIKTGEVTSYKSIYACARALGANSTTIKYHNGGVLKDQYLIKVSDKLDNVGKINELKPTKEVEI